MIFFLCVKLEEGLVREQKTPNNCPADGSNDVEAKGANSFSNQKFH